MIDRNIFCVLLISCLSVSCVSFPVQHKPNFILPGWVGVNLLVEEEAEKIHPDMLVTQWGEQVGALIQRGLPAHSTQWLKPAYGNENLLGVASERFGVQIQTDMFSAKASSTSDAESYQSSKVEVGNVEWRYVGFQRVLNEGDAVFQQYVFTCSSSFGDGYSVFYWGEQTQSMLSKYDQVLLFLEKLNHHCS